MVHHRTPAQIAKALGITLACTYVHMSGVRKALGFTPGKPNKPPEATPDDRCTPRQREVLELRAEGMRFREISVKLGIEMQSAINAASKGRIAMRSKGVDPASFGKWRTNTLDDPAFN